MGILEEKIKWNVNIILRMSKSIMIILKIAPTFDNLRQFFVFSREVFDSFTQMGRQRVQCFESFVMIIHKDG